MSRRIRFPTAAAFSIRRRLSRRPGDWSREGADIIDIGAESTRPYGGAVRMPLEEERARLAPVLPAVVTLGVPVSIDTLQSRDRGLGARSGRRHRQ